MNVTAKEVVSALKKQIAKSRQTLAKTGYNEAPVRARVVRLARSYGSPALDVGTGTGANMAVALARRGLRVTAVDHATSAVCIAQEWAARELSTNLEVRQADAADLPFPDNTYRIVTAFDALCHTADPIPVIKEMFRVCADDGAVIVTELNLEGRRITHHLDEGFDLKLPALLAEHCQNCQRCDDAHHVTFICEKF